VPRGGRAHRLRGRAEGGLPGGRPVPDPARPDRVDRDRRGGVELPGRPALERPLPAERPRLYGDGRAGERVVAALSAHGLRLPPA
jgi:hypothetical protein